MTRRKGGKDLDTTPGETLMSRYLEATGLSREPWPTTDGGRNPEFFIAAPQAKVLVEIKDFSEDELERAVLNASSEGRLAGGPWNPVQRVIGRVDKSLEQLKMGAEKYPCVCILYESSFTPYTRELFVSSALFGPMVITQEVGVDGALGEATSHHKGGIDPDKAPRKSALFDRGNTKHLSAVAVLEEIDPSAAERQSYINAFLATADRQDAIKFLGAVKKAEREAKRKFGPVTLFTRLRIYYNHNADIKLERSIFCGKYDWHCWFEKNLRQTAGYAHLESRD